MSLQDTNLGRSFYCLIWVLVYHLTVHVDPYLLLINYGLSQLLMLSALISCTVYTVVGCYIFRIYLLIADDGGEREYNVLVTVLPLFILV